MRVNRTDVELNRSQIYNSLLFGKNNFRSRTYGKKEEREDRFSQTVTNYTSRAELYIIVNCPSNLLCFDITVSFLHLLREIIMVSFERTTDLITSPNRRRKSAAFFRALSEKCRNAIVNFFLA